LDRLFYICAGVAGFLGVALGAFAAHALKASLPADMLAVFETGVRYQMYHVFALCAAAWGWARWQSRPFVFAGWLFVAGIGIFRQPLSAGAHGRAPARAITRQALAFLAGWLCLAGNVARLEL
jgi:uncharacterized membrane protein YgdD (TMEM256/DUF423 family)